MAYIALYRKLRPKYFKDVVGQESVIRTLLNQVRASRVSHAYLFCGTRGSGKTSTAKILARAINCENPQDGEPCGKCRPCADILEGRSVNVIEIDAASNNSVDDVRELREEIKYSPAEGKFKVYIIDEVHMLSGGAFNALLKTLEEPPAHAVFILATTDPQKIPPTVLSRCQRFNFKRVAPEKMANRLKEYMSEENVEISDEAVSYIASISDGAMRDALSVLDQCVSYFSGEEITLEKVREIVGSVDEKVFYDLLESLINQDCPRSLGIIDDFIREGRDVFQFIAEFIKTLRDSLVDIINNNAGSLDVSQNELIKYISAFSELSSKIKYDADPRISLEVLCIKLCAPFDPEPVKPQPQKKSIELPKTPPEKTTAKARPKTQNAEEAKKAEKEDLNEFVEKFEEYLTYFKKNSAHLAVFLQTAKPVIIDGSLYLTIADEQSKKHLELRSSKITTAAKNFFGKEYAIKFVVRAPEPRASDDDEENNIKEFIDNADMD